MEDRLTALADRSRWRIVALLAERPRAVGVVARLTGLRQPQATKHLQALERAGLVVSRRFGQRRVYALEPGPLRELAGTIAAIAETADAHRGDRDAFEQYADAVDAESAAADRPGWADERVFTFRRDLPAPPDVVWSHLTDGDLLAAWWAPRDLEVAEVVLEPRPGGRTLLSYREAGDVGGAVVGTATGVVDDVEEPRRLEFRLSPLLADGSHAFTAHYEFGLRRTGTGTGLDVRLRITDSTVPSAELVAGIELGWNQSLDNLVAATAAAAPQEE